MSLITFDYLCELCDCEAERTINTGDKDDQFCWVDGCFGKMRRLPAAPDTTFIHNDTGRNKRRRCKE